MQQKLICTCVALIVAALFLALSKPSTAAPDSEPPEPISQLELDLGTGIVGMLALAIHEGRGMEVAKELGFNPDREIKVESVMDLGEFAWYAPTGINKLGWTGTAYIQGVFEDADKELKSEYGILVYKLDDGPVIWIHATEEWLNTHVQPGMEPVEWAPLDFSGVDDEMRALIFLDLSPGEDQTIYDRGAISFKGDVGSVMFRLTFPRDMNGNYEIRPYDIWLKRSRVKEMQER